MSPEEAYALSRRLSSLKQIGEKIKNLLPEAGWVRVDGEDRRAVGYKLEGWLSEVEALVRSDFGNAPVFLARLQELREGAIQSGKSYYAKQVLDLLDTVEGFIFIDPQSVASEPLKNLIEQTLKERYFASWEVRALAGLFALAIACLFGGTAYLGFQVQGVTSQADAARKSIETEQTSITKLRQDAIKEIEANVNDQAKAQIAKLNDALDLATKSISNLNTHVENRTAAIDRTFQDGQKEVVKATQKAVGEVPSGAAAALTSQINGIVNSANQQVSERVEDAKKQIQDKIALVSMQKKNFEDALPDTAKYAENRVKEFNDVISRYGGRIDEILSRFEGGGKLTAIQAVSRVLGFAIWLIAGAVTLAIVACVIAILALARTRRTASRA